jgi:hypothetical protein
MKPVLAAAVVILSALLAPGVSAATPVEATLTLPHDHVLPGVPFDLVVTYTNVSSQPVTVGGALATLVVTFAGGETSVMHNPEGNDQWTLKSPAPLRLAPGQSGQQAASWERGCPNWFRYASFSGPGTYGIALDLRIVDDSNEPLAAVRTAGVTLTRIEPVGIDAELWKRMQGTSGGRWADDSFYTKEGAALAAEIMQLHPASGYYPYVLAIPALLRRDRGDIPALIEAAQRFPASPAHPYLLLATANSADYRALIAERAGDTAEALKYFELAQSNYSAALATKSIAVRADAEKGLRDVALELDRAKKHER